jgi:nucleoside-diphosphate-sugar epimerase
MVAMSPVGLGCCVPERCIGVLGATSLVGYALLPLLIKMDVEVAAFSRKRQDHIPDAGLEPKVTWFELRQSDIHASQVKSHISHPKEIKDWICLTPIWVLPDYFNWLKTLGAKRIVALSSTSRFTKADSQDPTETSIVEKLVAGEEKLIQWATEHGVEWHILRPTLIYGGAKDKNITEIARFIQRFGFFPLFGKGEGYRQPIHVEDVAMACYQALNQPSVANKAYNISGGEKLTYRDMVNRIFIALGKKPRVVTLPLPVLKFGLAIMKLIPRYRRLTSAMVTRMNQDMVFEHDTATRDFGFSPRSFELKKDDLTTC